MQIDTTVDTACLNELQGNIPILVKSSKGPFGFWWSIVVLPDTYSMEPPAKGLP